MTPASSREDFCAQTRLSAVHPFVLYICSSEFVAPREVEFVQRWVASVRESSDPVLRNCGLLVRPHPAHLKQWANVPFTGIANLAVWSDKETMNADQGLYDSLHHSAAVVGLNTSAMLEAGILGKPVLTLVSEEFAGGQQGTLHFHYLRAVNGGLLTEATVFSEHRDQLAAALTGTAAGDQARRFVERFVRPRGLQTPVTPIMASEIERAAEIRKARWRPPLWHLPLRLGMKAALAARAAGRGKPSQST